MISESLSKTILVAEDEGCLRNFVLAVLEKNGYSVILASDGGEALEKARAYSGDIHLLLSDIQMPRMTGTELAKRFLAERPKTQVLLMSGMDIGMSILAENMHFLPKPFMAEMLNEKIEAILGQPDAIALASSNKR